MVNDEDRKKKIKDHVKTQKKIIDTAKEIKNNCKDGIDHYKNISVNADSFIDNYEKNIQMVELQRPFVYDYSTSQWSSYLTMMNRDNWILEYLTTLNSDVQTTTSNIGQVAKSSGTVQIDVTYISGATMEIFLDIADGKTKQKIEEIGITTTLFDDSDYIEKTLDTVLNTGLSKDFESIKKDWSSSKDDDKFKILLNLRSLIWDQIIQPNNHYRKTEWYKKLGNTDFKNRFAKVKYYIIGLKNETDFLESTIKLIDADAWNLANCYDNLTIYGKKNGDISKIKETYNDTINSFRLVLMLRERFLSD
jgi:hypothetical protein